jgi:predicted RNase H-like nuclease (RuvC/YqgF family)
MINEVKDDNIFEYLMTSDFNENYRPDDYKYLLHKFRNFYKLSIGKHHNYKIEMETLVKNLQSSINSLDKRLYDEQVKSANLQNSIDYLKNPRKLTFKERLFGKINP